MANEIQNLTTDISRLYEEITEKTQSLGHLEAITKLYEELQNELQEISADEIDLLQTQIKSSLEQMVGISKNLAVIRAPEPRAPRNQRIWNFERECATRQRQAFRNQSGAEFGQQSIGGREAGGMIYQPGKRGRELHDTIMG